MSAEIVIERLGVTATITDYAWRCDDAEVLGALNSLLDPNGAGGQDPNPDYNAARIAAETLGGEIARYDETEYKEGVIY